MDLTPIIIIAAYLLGLFTALLVPTRRRIVHYVSQAPIPTQRQAWTPSERISRLNQPTATRP